MGKINLKDNIFIEGFDDESEINICGFVKKEIFNAPYSTIYKGKTSEIPEEIAKECVLKMWWNAYKDYSDRFLYGVSLKESIQSACNQTYCIIYKEK